MDLMETLTCISVIVAVICGCITIFGRLSDPVKTNEKRIETLENDVRKLKLDRDKEAEKSDSQVELNVVILKTLSALCKHEVDETQSKELEKCYEEIDDLIMKKGGAL